ncbi:MmcQ/YjbR family DNA-binding protein [Mucilaginibacter polytrichastri]|uniref:MmcQ/YjbR family DNA-binding protein n=1 Tax=Mucilaginibacter polytrichastri TaxID=1302689 RepID=UPI0008E13501|nr:MmcQ/YjbR family DNA-binding protein [Mucilaginibacter polytrichastri]SFS58791.1 Predicted DNA-binding protein, MmcQ/YjbR family [Mucilaginibacter polytrichastri]
MDIEQFREFCLSFDQATEGMPFKGFFRNSKFILVFYVRTRMFCLFDIESFNCVTIRCNSEEIQELKEKYIAIDKPFNLSHRSWISVRFNADMPDESIRSMVEASYNLAVKSLSKKE